MKSAEEILREHSSVCPKFPDPACRGVCICHADLAAIRAAQIDAAEWMRDEAAKECSKVRLVGIYGNHVAICRTREEIEAAIRSIKLPGDGE